MQDPLKQFEFGWREIAKLLFDVFISILKLDFNQINIQKGQYKLSKTCKYLKQAYEMNEQKHLTCQKTISQLEKRYSALCEHVNIKARQIVITKQFEAERRGQEFKPFGKSELRIWLSEYPEYIKEVEEADNIKIQCKALQKTEKAYAEIGHKLHLNFILCIQKYNNVNMAGHFKDIAEIIKNIKVEGMDEICAKMFHDVVEFQTKMLDMKDQANIDLQETDDVLTNFNDTSEYNYIQSDFLNEVLKMTGVEASSSSLNIEHLA